jgi:hypothetical protein
VERTVQRVQLGVRMEKRMVQVLKGLAEFEDISLGELMEKIVLHSFDPVPGDEGESCASPHSRRQLEAIAGLREVFGMDYAVHATRGFAHQASGSEAGADEQD